MFYTHRATYGRTAPERAAYAIGEKAGEEAPAEAKLPTDADLNMMAQRYFRQQGSGEQLSWDLAFENRIRGRIQKEASPRVNPIKEILSARRLKRCICVRSASICG